MLTAIVNVFTVIIWFCVLFLFFRIWLLRDGGKKAVKYMAPVFIITVFTAIYDTMNFFGAYFAVDRGIIMFIFLVSLIPAFKATGKIAAGREHYESGMNLLITALLLFFLFLLIKTAWISDDAYIAFRVIDNFINGYGLRWNVEERVQAFTNTLWMFTVMIFYLFIRNVYAVALVLCFVFTAAALLLLKKASASKEGFFIAALALAMSKAFTDFSVSGLENALTCSLIAVFFLIYIKQKISEKKIFYLTIISALLFLNRPDSVLFCAVPLLFTLYRLRKLSGIGAMLLGGIPVYLWEIFSIIYYGFPLPNTFYAKLATGVPAFDLIRHGGYYFENSLLVDPVTLFFMLSVILLPFAVRGKAGREKGAVPFVFLSGVVLYLLFVLMAGGDFMSGRFFAVPVFVCALVISRLDIHAGKSRWPVFAAALIFAAILSPYFPVSRNEKNLQILSDPEKMIMTEREYYYGDTGLLSILEKGKDGLLQSMGARNAERAKSSVKNGRALIIGTTLGVSGYYSGPQVYYIDKASLTDAFSVRLPVVKRWRIGHFTRIWPDGYVESRLNNLNLIKDPKLADLYDKILLITKGPLFDKERWKAIWEVNTGRAGKLQGG